MSFPSLKLCTKKQRRWETDNKECAGCVDTGPDLAWMMVRSCGHVCVCSTCCKEMDNCPDCRGIMSEPFPAFFWKVIDCIVIFLRLLGLSLFIGIGPGCGVCVLLSGK
mmetsp:Transcript_81626/g.132314  ORF Transcript_81626/g.132314 Transcript_81626/m.132314 type:complete len:108 (-) Transcript_81626:274-597(-)